MPARAAGRAGSTLTRGLCQVLAHALYRRVGDVQGDATRLRRDEDESVTTPPGSARRVWPWVLAVVARPYQWWRVGLVVGSGLAYVVIFSIPQARQKFLLDPSNVPVTAVAFGIGVLGAAAIEASWWIRARMFGERPRLWRQGGERAK